MKEEKSVSSSRMSDDKDVTSTESHRTISEDIETDLCKGNMSQCQGDLDDEISPALAEAQSQNNRYHVPLVRPRQSLMR
jgi:hypothetical protein